VRDAIVRQEREEIQHNDAVPLIDMKRLFVGRDEETMSANRFWNAGSPTFGVNLEVAPGGLQSVRPSPQSSSMSGMA
jgi:hypothetical protein